MIFLPEILIEKTNNKKDLAREQMWLDETVGLMKYFNTAMILALRNKVYFKKNEMLLCRKQGDSDKW